MDSLLVEQEFMNGIDTDKVHPYIEDQIAQKVDLVKVSSHFFTRGMLRTMVNS